MGQYYKAIIIENDNIQLYEPHTFECGAKLMEHSWISNPFVNQVYTSIDKPKRVAWIGDYSCDNWEEEEPFTNAIPSEEFQQYYDMVWGENSLLAPAPAYDLDILSDRLHLDTSGVFLVNHSRMLYLDIGEYIKSNKVQESPGDWWCISPLPLLVACGNDRGGGDFCRGNEGYENVGIWAFDLLQYIGDRPDSTYQEVQFTFKEIQNPSPVLQTSTSFSGKNIVVTGVIAGYTRADIERLIISLGATMQKSISAKTDYLVIASKPGATKLNAAKRLGTPTLTEAQFRAMAGI